MFNKELTRLLMLPNKEDKFMQFKIQNAKKKRHLLDQPAQPSARSNAAVMAATKKMSEASNNELENTVA